MEFSYDLNKSDLNKEKHGIDFEEAQQLWDDTGHVVFGTNHLYGEPRKLVLGKVNEKIWLAVTTERDDSIRIISVRRARKKEVLFYAKKNYS